jgi:hypothetical protein
VMSKIGLMTEAASISETSVNLRQTTRRNIPKDSHLHFSLFISPPPPDKGQCILEVRLTLHRRENDIRHSHCVVTSSKIIRRLVLVVIEEEPALRVVGGCATFPCLLSIVASRCRLVVRSLQG